MKNILDKIWVIVAIGALSYLAIRANELISIHKKYDSTKEDIAEINKINYGLFNIALWKTQALAAADKRVDDFKISDKAFNQARKELEKYLTKVNKDYIDNGKVFEPIFAEAEKNPKVNKVFLKLLKENTLPQIKELNIPKFIPGMAKDMANDLRQQEPELRALMHSELHRMLEDTSSVTKTDPRQAIYQKYKVTDQAAANQVMNTQLAHLKTMIDQRIYSVFGGLAWLFVCSWVATYAYSYRVNIGIMTIATMLLLWIGLQLPMMNIEGLLNAFTIDLLGTPISFDQQYIYYQSKSILDVTTTLIESRGLDTKVVGYMILAFSVLFPFIKLIMSIVYIYSHRLSQAKWVQNIIFYLGKWSMADVFVVALFMSYIGFYGIIASQLSSIERNRGGFAVETINNSHLAYGALFFTSFCISSIIIGIIINRRHTKSA